MYKCDNLRIMWYNTWCLPLITSTHHVCEIANSVVHMIASDKPHIVALCEVFDGSQTSLIREINDRLEYPLSVLTTRYGSKWWGKQSSGLLVMYDPIAFQSAGIEAFRAYFEPFDQCCSIDCLSTKGMIRLFVKPTGSGEGNTNTHLQLVFTHLQDGNALAMSQSCINTTKQQLMQAIKSSQNHRLPFMIMGDLNIDPNISREFLHVEHTEPVHIVYYDAPTHKNKNIFDYAIYSPELSNRVDVSIVKQCYNPSDHAPILATIQLSANDTSCRFDHQNVIPKACTRTPIKSHMIPLLVTDALLIAIAAAITVFKPRQCQPA